MNIFQVASGGASSVSPSMAGMKVERSGEYGGWNPNPKSDVLEHVIKIYKEQNG